MVETRVREYKTFNTRKFPAELHHRLRMLAAARNYSMQQAFEDVVAAGLDIEERKLAERESMA